MLKVDAIAYFGNQRKLAAALGLKQPSIARWPEVVPPLRQLQLERVTHGALKAAADVFDKQHKNGGTQ